jgi:hypothetical protein
MRRISIGILYLGLHNQLIKKYGENKIINRKEFFIKIGRHAQIPKKIRPLVLLEMENRNLIKKIDRDKIKILKEKVDLENNLKKLYKLAGIR